MVYYKIIDGQEVFNSGTSLWIDGIGVSNPTPEMYEAEGWTAVPEHQNEPGYEDIIGAIKKMFSTDINEMTDEDALNVAVLYPTWYSKIGEEVTVGTRLWDDGSLWKVLQPHTVQKNWRPADSPSLFVRVTVEEWPEWIQPVGSTDAYRLGAKVTHNDLHWISEIDYNTYEPGVYGWRQP